MLPDPATGRVSSSNGWEAVRGAIQHLKLVNITLDDVNDALDAKLIVPHFSQRHDGRGLIERGEYVLQDAVEERLGPAGEAWRWGWTTKGQAHGAQAELNEQEGGHFALLIYRAELFTRGNWYLAPGAYYST